MDQKKVHTHTACGEYESKRKQIMRSEIDECNLWRSAAEQNITKESRMIYVCVKFFHARKKAAHFSCCPQNITTGEKRYEYRTKFANEVKVEVEEEMQK